MTIAPYGLFLYAAAMAALVATPGPVSMAIVARALAGGIGSSWSLAAGVAVGHQGWPLAAIFGLGWLLPHLPEVMIVIRWTAVAVFLCMGLRLLLRPHRPLSTDAALTRPSHWAGFAAGIAAVVANPNTIVFYVGALPGFFNIARLTGRDVAAILAISLLIPLAGNLALAMLVGQARGYLGSAAALRRINRLSGCMLLLAGAAIALG